MRSLELALQRLEAAAEILDDLISEHAGTPLGRELRTVQSAVEGAAIELQPEIETGRRM